MGDDGFIEIKKGTIALPSLHPLKKQISFSGFASVLQQITVILPFSAVSWPHAESV
jgi:hypothetical protein